MDTNKDLNEKKGAKKRYRFRKLSERVRGTDVGVSRVLLAEHEFLEQDAAKAGTQDEQLEATFLQAAMTRESQADRSRDFVKLLRALGPMTQSLPLILHNLGKIIKLITRHLRKAETKVPALRLLPALAKDAQQELYDHLSDILAEVFGLVEAGTEAGSHAANLPLCTAAFQCVGTILSELGKCITERDPELAVLRPHLTSLLSHRREHVRRFAGETFAPLMRQQRGPLLAKQVKRLIVKMACAPDCLERDERLQEGIVDGVAYVIFNLVRNVQQRLHSRTSEVLQAAFATVQPKAVALLDEPLVRMRFRCLLQVLRHTLEFVSRYTSAPLWQALLAEAPLKAPNSHSFAGLLELVNFCVAFKGRSRVAEGVTHELLEHFIVEPVLCDSPAWLEGPADAAAEKARASLRLEALRLGVSIWRYEHHGGRDCDAMLDALRKLFRVRLQRSDMPRVVAVALQCMPDRQALFDGLLAERIGALSVFSTASGLPPSSRKGKKRGKAAGDDGGPLELVRAAPNAPALEAVAAMASALASAPDVKVDDDDRFPANSDLAAAIAALLRAPSSTPEELALAVSATRLMRAGNDCFEPALVHFIVDPERKRRFPELVHSAVEILCAQGVWTVSQEHDAYRTKLVDHFVTNFDEFVSDAAALDSFARMVAGSGLLSEATSARLVDEFKPALVENLLSPALRLRVASLRVLREVLPELDEAAREGDDSTVELKRSDVLDVMVDIESLPIEYREEKERHRLFGRIEKTARASRLPEPYKAPVAGFLLGQFFVPYSPVWKMATSAMEAFSAKENFHTYLWPLLWKQVLFVSKLNARGQSDQTVAEETETPAAADGADGANAPARSTQALDAFKEVFAAMGPIAKKVEAKADQIVTLFFLFLRDEYYLSSGRHDDLDQPRPDEDENAFLANADPALLGELAVSSESTLRTSSEKLCAWLKLFGGFTKFRKEKSWTPVLRSVLERLLIKSDYQIPELALKVLRKMKVDYLEGNFDMLEAMADENRFKDAITGFRLSDIDKRQREGLIPVIARVLYARLLVRRRKTNKDALNMGGRRTTVFTFFSSVAEKRDVKPLLDILFRPFPPGLDFQVDRKDPAVALRALQVSGIEVSRLSGFVNSLGELIKTLGTVLDPFLDNILAALFAILMRAREEQLAAAEAGAIAMADAEDDKAAEEEEEEEEEEEVKQDDEDDEDGEGGGGKSRIKTRAVSQLRIESLRRLSEIFETFYDADFETWTTVFREVVQPSVNTLPSSVLNQNRAPTLLLLADSLAQSKKLARWAFEKASPSLFSQCIRCLSAGLDSDRSAGPRIVATVYGMVEIALKDEEQARALVAPNLPLLLGAILQRFQAGGPGHQGGTIVAAQTSSKRDKQATQQAKRAMAKRELRLLYSLAALCTPETMEGLGDEALTETCSKLVELLMPFMRSFGANSFGTGRSAFSGKSSSSAISGGHVQRREQAGGRHDGRADLFMTLARLMRLSRPTLHDLGRISRYLGVNGIDPVYDVEARERLLDVFEVLGEVKALKAVLKPVVPLLRGLNKWDPKRVHLFDFDARLSAYETLTEQADTFVAAQWAPFVHQALLDMHEDEYPLRSAASHFLQTVILRREVPDLVSDTIPNVLMPGLRAGIKADKAQIRKGFVDLLAKAVEFGSKLQPADLEGATMRGDHAPDLEHIKKLLFADLQALADNEDPEHDFFTSMVHVQAYRQSGYLRYLRERLANGEVTLGSSTLLHVVLPLTLSNILESSTEKAKNMKEAGLNMVGQIGALLPWTHYANLVKFLIETAGKRKDLSKRLLSCACLVIDNYHFPHASEEPKLERALQFHILPLLEKFMVDRSGKGGKTKALRVSVAVSIVKVLKLLPERALTLNLPRMLTQVVDVMKSFSRELRTAARETLNAMALELGAKHFHQVVQVLLEGLTEGYQLHIRGYSLHALLVACEDMLVRSLEASRKSLGQVAPAPAPGEPAPGSEAGEAAGEAAGDAAVGEESANSDGNSAVADADADVDATDVEKLLRIDVCAGELDEHVPKIMAVVQEELFGELALQKRSDSAYHSRVKQLTESKTNRSNETLEILGRMIAFLPQQTIHAVIQPMMDKIDSSSDIRELRIAEEALRRVALGLARNRDVRVPHLLVYIHHLISNEYSRAAAGQRRKRIKSVQPSTTGEGRDDGGDSGGEEDGEADADVRPSLSEARSGLSSWVVAESQTEQDRARERVKLRRSYQSVHIVEEVPQMTGKDRFEVKRKRNSQQVQVATRRANKHLIIEHALGLLLSALKAKRLDKSNEQHRDMLNPFVELLTFVCKESKASKTTVLALRVLTTILPWDLPATHAHVPTLVRSIMRILQKSGFSSRKTGGGASASSVGASEGSTAVDASQESIKALTLILRTCDNHGLDPESLKLLVLLGQHNLSIVGRQQSTIALMRSIVERRLVVSEMYELMTTLSEQVFTSGSNNVRQEATKVLVQFFTDYPLSAKRLRQHLDLVLANLEFKLEDGRLSGLHMLKTIIDRFPTEVLDDIAQYFFFQLVLRLVNDDSPRCRAAVGVALRRMFARVGAAALNELVGFVRGWLDSGPQPEDDGGDEQEPVDPAVTHQKAVMRRAAVQVVGLMAETSNGKLLRRQVALDFLQEMLRVLRAELLPTEEHSAWEEAFLEREEGQGEGEGWLTAQAALVAVHKLCLGTQDRAFCADFLVRQRHDLGGSEGEQTMLESVVLPLLRFHPHMWVRLAALRLLGQAFDSLEPSTVLTGDKRDHALATLEQVSWLTRLHVNILNRPELDAKLADQAVKNLVWIMSVLLAHEEKHGVSADEGAVSADEAEAAEDDAESDAPGAQASDEAEDRMVQRERGAPQARGMAWALHKLASTARFRGGMRDDYARADLRQSCVFKLFAFVATQWKDRADRLRGFLPLMLSPLVRVATQQQQVEVMGHKLSSPALAKEVLDLLEELTGTAAFVRCYSKVQVEIEEVRQSRKRKAAVDRISDVQATQKLRQARHEAKRRSKKRKVQRYRDYEGR